MVLPDELLSFLGWNDSDASFCNGPYHITLEEKLLNLRRIAYACYFQELRNNQPVTQPLQRAYKLLAQDAFSAGNRTAALTAIVNTAWPPGSWNFLAPNRMYLHTPNGCPKQNITQHAFIRVNQAKKPVSTVTLIGQHGQEEFDLRDSSQLYKLFDAVVDSEFIFALKESLRFQDALQQTVEPPPQSTAHAHPGSPSIIGQYQHAWNSQVPPPAHALVIRNGQVRPHARVLAIKNGPKEVTKKPSRRRLMERDSFKTNPCRMRYQLLPYCAIPFHLITWPRSESVVPPSDLAESSGLRDFITVDGEAGCEHDEMLLFYLMGLTMERLEQEGFALLAHEVCDLRIRLSRSRHGLDPPFGPTSGRLLTVEPHGLNDKIHIICREDVEGDKIRMWVVNEDQGQQSCIIRIEKHSDNASRTISSLGKREVSSSPRVYCDIALKKVKVE